MFGYRQDEEKVAYAVGHSTHGKAVTQRLPPAVAGNRHGIEGIASVGQAVSGAQHDGAADR